MKILAIETSCDETSVAVVEKKDNDKGVTVISCVTASSEEVHKETGGIIPENAARKQIEYILPTLELAIKKAIGEEETTDTHHYIKKEIDAIAVTYGPGLIGSLLVGIETAKTLAAVFNKPIIPINHIAAHIYANFIGELVPSFPLLAVVVSGGHTDFVYMKDHGSYERLGGTRDDAAGEAFDKCARIIGLPYPGGPSISAKAEEFIQSNPDMKLNLLPRPMIFQDTIDLSFSGLKTATSRLVKGNESSKTYSVSQLAAEIQEAIVDSLIDKTEKAISKVKVNSVVLCGGVSGNSRLRNSLKGQVFFKPNMPELHVPLLKYCTDNAAMIGSCALFNNIPVEINLINPNPELHF